MAHPDQTLLARIQQRDEEAFTELFTRYRDGIRRQLAGILHDRDVVEDVLQEVFLRVWTCAEQWDGRGEVRAWLARIATNLALNQLRTLRRRREQTLEILPEICDDEDALPGWMLDAAAIDPDLQMEAAERSAQLHRLVDELPEEKRAVIRLIYDAEMDIRQAATKLGIPEGTVKSRLHHARKLLAREWQTQDE